MIQSSKVNHSLRKSFPFQPWVSHLCWAGTISPPTSQKYHSSRRVAGGSGKYLQICNFQFGLDHTSQKSMNKNKQANCVHSKSWLDAAYILFSDNIYQPVQIYREDFTNSDNIYNFSSRFRCLNILSSVIVLLEVTELTKGNLMMCNRRPIDNIVILVTNDVQ